MKWVAWMAALLAIVSGCVSLNKGSDQVAPVTPGKETAAKPSSPTPVASVPAENTAAAPNPGDRLRDLPHREADPLGEVSVTSPPPATDPVSERVSTRVVRTSTRELPPQTACCAGCRNGCEQP